MKSCPGCGAPPEAAGCSYCGRGKREIGESGYYEGMTFDEWVIRHRSLQQQRARQDAQLAAQRGLLNSAFMTYSALYGAMAPVPLSGGRVLIQDPPPQPSKWQSLAAAIGSAVFARYR